MEEEEKKRDQSKDTQKTDKIEKQKLLWGKLKNFLLKKEKFTISGQIFMELIKQTEDEQQFTYNYCSEREKGIQIQIKKPVKEIGLNEIKEFNQQQVDSTGIDLWPAQQILGYYSIKNYQLLKQAGLLNRLIELGAGYSGLAGQILLKYIENDGIQPESFIISDGQKNCAEGLKENVELNFPSHSYNFIKTCCLIWEQNYQNKEENFDLILISDCLFFRKFHIALRDTILGLLSSKGLCIIVAPNRDNTLKEFLQICKDTFKIQLVEFKDEQFNEILNSIQSSKDFDPDQNVYYFIHLSLK